MSAADQLTRVAPPAPTGRLRTRDRLQHQGDFRRVLRKGRRAQGRHLGIAVARAQDGRPRLGLAVAKGAGHAPARARLRRLVREAFRAVRPLLGAAVEVVVFVRQPWPDAGLADVATELRDLLRPWRSGGSG